MMTFHVKEGTPAQAAPDSAGAWRIRQTLTDRQRIRVRAFVFYLAAVTLVFIQPLVKLVLLAAHSSLQSYILLVPLISGYLLYIRRGRLLIAHRTSILRAFTAGVFGAAALASAIAWHASLSINDELTLITLSYLCTLWAGGFLFLGSKWMSAAAFPLVFLLFIIPLPDAMVIWLENASASRSADAAALYFNALGTPLVRHGRVFELPGIVLQVAQECSGIHSSLVLFMTSLVGSQLLLRTCWGRTALVAFVLPLGILRNGFRILVIGLLCVHVGPQMINSSIHRHGGPVFFVLSLIPLFLLLVWLRLHEPKNFEG